MHTATHCELPVIRGDTRFTLLPLTLALFPSLAESGGFPFPPHHFPGFPGFPGPGGLQPGGLQPGGGDEDGDEDGEFPARPYRPPGAGSSGSSGGGGHRLGGDGEAAAYDWGSPAAKQAVETLQAMGAQVFPPGSKEKLDWGVLAGGARDAVRVGGKAAVQDCGAN